MICPSCSLLHLDAKLESFITHRDGYDRNHGAIPHIDAAKHLVRIDGAVKNVLELSIGQIKNDFKQYDIICALQCAGNRRHTMRTLLKEVDGIDWGDGAVMNCRWSGPKLRDILNKAQITTGGSQRYHVAFACFQTECQEDSWYGGSIKLERAMRDDGDVILALKVRWFIEGFIRSLLSAADEWRNPTHQSRLSCPSHRARYCRGAFCQVA